MVSEVIATPSFKVHFVWSDGELDAWCSTVPRVGEHVRMPGANRGRPVTNVLHSLIIAEVLTGEAFQQVTVRLADEA